MEWARAELGDLSVLVNNAGMIRRAPAQEAAAEDWQAIIALNLTAPFLLSQAFTVRCWRKVGRATSSTLSR